MKYYVLFVWDDIEPSLYGPYDTEEERDNKAKDMRFTEGSDHGIYRLNIENGEPKVGSYCGTEFKDVDQEAYDRAMKLSADIQKVRENAKNN